MILGLCNPQYKMSMKMKDWVDFSQLAKVTIVTKKADFW